MSVILIRLLPFIVAALGGAGVAAWTAHSIDNGQLVAARKELSDYKEQVLTDTLVRERNADKALQDQLDERKAAETANAQTRQSLEDQLAATARDRDFARRLLQRAQATRTASSAEVPATFDRSGTAEAGPSAGDQQTVDELGNAAFECRAAILTLTALQAELIPQLQQR